MSTKYYRFLYHQVSKGVCFTASFGAEHNREGYHLLYISDGAGVFHTGHLECLVLADLTEETVASAGAVLEKDGADTVVVPAGEEPIKEKWRQRYPQSEIVEVAHTHEICAENMEICFLCAQGQLLMYLGSKKEKDAGEECVMNVKTAVPALPCSAIVDASNLNCEMRCLLHQDIVQCKRHNGRNETYFVDGHLLTGKADLHMCLSDLHTYLEKQWKKIRFVTLPGGGKKQLWEEGLLDIGTDGYRVFMIGNREADAEIIKTAAVFNPYRQFACIGEDAGICVSGCYCR